MSSYFPKYSDIEGVNNHHYCPSDSNLLSKEQLLSKLLSILQLSLAVWLEYHFELNPEPNDFVFSYKGLTCPISMKQKFQNLIIVEFSAPDFENRKPGLWGTYSVRKLLTLLAEELVATR